MRTLYCKWSSFEDTFCFARHAKPSRSTTIIILLCFCLKLSFWIILKTKALWLNNFRYYRSSVNRFYLQWEIFYWEHSTAVYYHVLLANLLWAPFNISFVSAELFIFCLKDDFLEFKYKIHFVIIRFLINTSTLR